ncbi:MAG: alpha/beta fold hydrolase, partial [Planctomycetota bacterium JB042]
ALLLLCGAAWGVWSWMGRARYEPGEVREAGAGGPRLEPPVDDAPVPGTWLVEAGVRLAHRSIGEGDRLLVLHGGPSVPFVTAPEGFARLGERRRVTFFDQRGCGGSTRPFERLRGGMGERFERLERTLGLGAQIADVERVRRILGEERLVLVGHSFGGLLAVLYAAEFPEHVRALVLVAPADLVVMPSLSGDLFSTIRARLPDDRREEFDAFLGEYLDYGTLGERSDAELAALHARLGAWFAAASTGASASVPREGIGGFAPFAMYLSLGRSHDWSDAVRAIEAPTLLVHGDRDLVPVDASRHVASRLEDATVEVIEGAGHFPFSDRPEAFAEAVERFLDALPAE